MRFDIEIEIFIRDFVKDINEGTALPRSEGPPSEYIPEAPASSLC